MSRWDVALGEQQEVVDAFVAAISATPRDLWQRRHAPDRWTAAELAQHVCDAYAMGRDAPRGAPSMRLRVSPLVALLSRTFMFPMMIRMKRFPREAPVPRELRPDPERARALSQERAIEQLRVTAAQAYEALLEADRSQPAFRLTHAYFGPLKPLQAVRLLSAHTRHHVTGMIERGLRWQG